jgi:hypothetical protein
MWTFVLAMHAVALVGLILLVPRVPQMPLGSQAAFWVSVVAAIFSLCMLHVTIR